MKKSMYVAGKLGQYWYNSTEYLAYALLHRKVPDTLVYQQKLKYGDDKQETVNTFWLKSNQSKKKPLFLYIHGGGWISGIVNMRNAYVMEYAERGFFAASIDYTYAPRAVYPTQIQQCFKAIDWLYDHAEEYNIDMDNVLIAGESAGGYFISMIGAICADHTLYDKLKIDFKHRDQFKVTAINMICGAVSMERLTDKEFPSSRFPGMAMMLRTFLDKDRKQIRPWLNTEQGKLASPVLTKDFPPTMVIWAAHDMLRFEDKKILEDLRALNVPCGEYGAEGIISMHAFPIATIEKRGKDCLKQTLDFLLPFFPKYYAKDGDGWKYLG